MTINQPRQPEQATPWVTLTLALAILSASLGTSIANIALPTLTAVFSAPFAQVQAVVIAYLAAMALSVVPAGRLGDRYGLKPFSLQVLGSSPSLRCCAPLPPSCGRLSGQGHFRGLGRRS